MTTSACLLGAGLFLKNLNDAPTVTVSVKPWAWISDVRVGVDQPKWVEDSSTLEMPQRLAWSHLDVPKIKKSSSWLAVGKKSPRRPRGRHEATVLLASAQNVTTDVLRDDVSWFPSAPAREEPAAVLVEPTGDSTGDVSSAELQKMRTLYGSVRHNFYVALNTQDLISSPRSFSEVNTQLTVEQKASIRWAKAAPGEALAYVRKALGEAPVAKSAASRSGTKLATHRKARQVAPKVEVAQAQKVEEVQEVQKQASIEPALQAADLQYNRMLLAASQVIPIPKDQLSRSAAKLAAAMATPKDATSEGLNTQPDGRAMLLSAASAEERAATKQTGYGPALADQLEVTQAKGSETDSNEAQGMSDYSGVGFKMGPAQALAVNSQAGRGYSAGFGSAAAGKQGAGQNTTEAGSNHQADSGNNALIAMNRSIGRMNALANVNPLTDSSQTPYIEALAGKIPVQGTKVETLVREAEGGGWEIARATDHIGTLSRGTKSHSDARTPMISTNTAHLLAFNSGVKLQADTSIVFGIVPEGWTVSFSGRSERGIFLNAQAKLVSESRTDGFRTFFFLNASPGAHLLYLSKNGHAAAAIGIPVVASLATYVDLTDVRNTTARGTVLDADSTEASGLSGVRVRAVGASTPEVVTDARGQFQIHDLVAVSDYSTVIETESANGYTHRYMVRPRQLGHLQLFRMSEAQVRDWIGQLEGGVSPESGMIVGVAPMDVVAGTEGKTLYPATRMLAKDSNLQPETYSLSKSGQLQVKTAIDAEVPRFLAVQVPEGPVAAEVRTSSKTLMWSELVFAQPGIINVIAP